jgi:hypothetical protein
MLFPLSWFGRQETVSSPLKRLAFYIKQKHFARFWLYHHELLRGITGNRLATHYFSVVKNKKTAPKRGFSVVTSIRTRSDLVP